MEDDLIEGKFLELSTIWAAEKSLNDMVVVERIWRTRHIGIFFAKRQETWVFLVLIAPLSTKHDIEVWKGSDFRFCVRSMQKPKPDEWVAEDVPLQDLIMVLVKGLDEMGPRFLTYFLIDVFWGWERYFAQIQNDIRGVRLAR